MNAMPRIALPAYLAIVRASAIYDLVVTAAFATPWTFLTMRNRLSALNQGLGGHPLPPFEPFHVLIACLMGSIVLVWSLLRLRHPSVRLGRFDALGRMLFTGWMTWALAVTGEPLLWLFVVPEFSWGLLQFMPVGSRACGDMSESGQSNRTGDL